MMTTHRASLFVAAAFLTALTAGCSEEPAAEIEAPAEAEAPAAPAEVEAIDLTQTPDLFEEPLQPNPLAPTADDVIITVNGKEITHGEIMQAVQMTMMQLSRQMPPQQLSQMYGQVYQNMTDTLVANALLENAAATSSLAVSDADLEEEINAIKANAPEGQTLEEVLAENNVDINEWKETQRMRLLVGKLVEEKTANIEAPTLAEVAAFYAENQEAFQVPENVAASHILIAFDEADTDATKAEKKAELEGLKKQLDEGASFEELAGTHSDCPSSAQGGSLGTFGRGQMVPEFEDAAFSMDVGAVSGIVETQFGYHLIKVTDHQEGSLRPLAEVTEQLTDYLAGQKKQEALVAYIDELKDNADIVVPEQDLDGGAAE